MAGPSQEEGFDQVLEHLRAVVDRLEHGNLGLEESLKIFEEGVMLARRGHSLLDAAEKRVEMLTKTPAGGEEVVPFPGAGGGA